MSEHQTSRRQALQTLLATSAAATGVGMNAGCAQATGPAAFGSLDSIGRAKGLRVGTAVGLPDSGSTQRFGFNNADYRALIARECGLLVCENEMKWPALRPSATRFSHQRAETIAQWAAQQGLVLRGHTLLWADPKMFPAWAHSHDYGSTPALARASVERLLSEHIAAVCAHYPQVDSWDVVNEAVAPDTGGLRANPFADRLGGIESIELAFRQARAHAPKAQLVYNDYMGWGNSSAKHRAGVLKLLAELKRRGAPIDALGVQGHVGTAGDGSPMDAQGGDEREWRKFLDEASGMGLDLLITEFDINDRFLSNDVSQRDQQVASITTLYLDLMLSYRNLHSLTFWGLADHLSWLQNRWPRTDGAAKRPLPYDAQLQPKPMREATAQALRRMAPRAARRVG